MESKQYPYLRETTLLLGLQPQALWKILGLTMHPNLEKKIWRAYFLLTWIIHFSTSLQFFEIPSPILHAQEYSSSDQARLSVR